MLTVEQLRNYGANVDEALKRCMNNEGFYLRLVKKAMQDPYCDQLKEAIEAKDFDRAFELAHALKGVAGNLSLTPLYKSRSARLQSSCEAEPIRITVPFSRRFSRKKTNCRH